MYLYQRLLTIWDIILPPFYLLIILVVAFFYQQSKRREHPEYKNFVTGLVFKIFGGLGFALIYLFYYDGGDTTLYYESTLSLLNLAQVDPGRFLSILSGNLSNENAALFGSHIGYNYYWRDFQSYSVVRLSAPFVLIGARSYITATILIASFTYIGMWKLYRFLYYRFPEIKKGAAFAVLFIPSTLFWGSGLLKDSFTLMGASLMLVCLYYIFVIRKKIVGNIFGLIVCFYLLVSLKPYIFFAVLAAFLITMAYQYIKEIKNKVVKVVFIPVIIVVIFASGAYFMLYVGRNIGGQYSSVEGMLEKASGTQFDLKQAYYEGNTFDIGSFEPTIGGVLSKAHLAILAGLFRPYLWDSRNPVMLISALENSLLLFLTIYILVLSFATWRKQGGKYLRRIIFSDSYIIYSLIFVLLFSFSVGISTANFGALVRYKIPLIPFYLSTLFIIARNINKERMKEKKNKKSV